MTMSTDRSVMLRRGRRLEYVTRLEHRWDRRARHRRDRGQIGRGRGFGLDSLIEIGASTVVLWELASVAEERQHLAIRLIGSSFIALVIYLLIQSTLVLVVGFHPHHSVLGIIWTAANRSDDVHSGRGQSTHWCGTTTQCSALRGG